MVKKTKTDEFGVMKNWKRAEGIKARRNETNSSFAERDYSIKCKTGLKPIIIFGGYWIWWCKTHQQPLAWCEKKKIKKQLEGIKKIVKVKIPDG